MSDNNPFGIYGNHDTQNLDLFMENVENIVNDLRTQSIESNFGMTGADVKKYVEENRSGANFRDYKEPVLFSRINWNALASLWNADAREHVAEAQRHGNANVAELNQGIPVPEAIISILARATFSDHGSEGATLVKLAGQLDRKLYLDVNKMFYLLGGKWDRRIGGHLFETSPERAIRNVVETQRFDVKKAYDFGYFPTPESLAHTVIAKANIRPGDRVLEPEIGQGHLADIIVKMHPDAKVYGYEINPRNHTVSSRKHEVVLGDFMQVQPTPTFDRVVMNPPFEKGQDVDHVRHAMGFLKPGGVLVSIMAAGVKFRSDKHYTGFRDLVADLGGQIADNPDGAFKSSGTGVNTVTVVLTKPLQPELAARVVGDATNADVRPARRAMRA